MQVPLRLSGLMVGATALAMAACGPVVHTGEASSPGCRSTAPRAIPGPMAGGAATMVGPGPLRATVCRYGSTGLLSRSTLDQPTALQWAVDFNLTRSVQGALSTCDSDDGSRLAVYFAYADGSVRVVQAITSPGCFRLWNGVRRTYMTAAVEADLSLALAARVRGSRAAKPLERVQTR